MDPITGNQLELCPWLRKAPEQNVFTCDIYNNRPEDCRIYPVTIDEMVRDECEMLEPKDLSDQKQAQKDLDKLMEDSRPEYQPSL